MKKVTSKSIEETQIFARNFLNSLTPREAATVVGLYGNLGAGKTVFVKDVAKEMGILIPVTSPTFVIEKIYETTHPLFKRLIHIDAYRLERAEELQVLNFEGEVGNKNNLIFIEWPENVKEILPLDHTKIYCEFIDENTREYRVE